MSKELVKQVLTEMAATHARLIELIASISESDLNTPVQMRAGEMPLRNVLLVTANHDREHKNQVAKTLQWLGVKLSETQMIAASAEQARGELIGLMAVVDDEILERVPKEGEWTLRETLKHINDGQTAFTGRIAAALKK